MSFFSQGLVGQLLLLLLNYVEVVLCSFVCFSLYMFLLFDVSLCLFCSLSCPGFDCFLLPHLSIFLFSPLQKEQKEVATKTQENTKTTILSLLPYPRGGVKNVIYNFGCVKMQVLENGEI